MRVSGSVYAKSTSEMNVAKVIAERLPPLTYRRQQAAWVIQVLNQYKRIVCSPGKHPGTRTMVTVLDDDSRDNVHGRCLCIAV